MSGEFMTREDMIKKYIMGLDFKKGDWTVNGILEGLKPLLKETPGIDISYKKDALFNEDLKETQVISLVDKITIVYTEGDVFKKLVISPEA